MDPHNMYEARLCVLIRILNKHKTHVRTALRLEGGTLSLTH